MDDIARAIATASDYLSAHPAEAAYTDSVAAASVEGGLRVRVTGSAGEELVTDMPSSVGGSASAPSPGWFMRAAEASCVVTLITMRAAQLGLGVGRVEVEVDSESDDRGILGLTDDVPAGPLSVSVRVKFAEADADEAALDDLVAWAVAHCPVIDAVVRAVPLTVDVRRER